MTSRGPNGLTLAPDGERFAYSAGDPGYEVWKLSNFLGRLGASDD